MDYFSNGTTWNQPVGSTTDFSTSTVPETCPHVEENRWFVLRDRWNMERRVCARCFVANISRLPTKADERVNEKNK
jgi:hypothetical protein